MAYTAFLIFLSFIFTCIHVLKLGQKKNSLSAKRLPPRISLLSIIQNYTDLSRIPHQALAKLSKTYGPIMSFKQGNMTIIVTSTPKLAKEVLQTQDKILSGRPTPDAVRALDHYNGSMIWLQPHSKWRVFRKICNSEIFSLQKVETRVGLRQKKVQELLDYVQSCCDKGQAVDVGQVAFTTSLNLLSNTLFSIDLASYHSKRAYEFKELVWAASEQIGRPNSVDYYPILGVLDPQGIRRATKFNAERIIAVFEGIINQRLQFNKYLEGKDVIDAFLKFHKENGTEFSLHDIKHLLVVSANPLFFLSCT
ncbi:Cytochrome P450 [Dillenia turbinata]|uniref:Cytochrome P450 n=1 Tax=Dillenia turbinata TaxID=194707 RepID=A0AAN8UYW0_9MAGN